MGSSSSSPPQLTGRGTGADSPPSPATLRCLRRPSAASTRFFRSTNVGRGRGRPLLGRALPSLALPSGSLVSRLGRSVIARGCHRPCRGRRCQGHTHRRISVRAGGTALRRLLLLCLLTTWGHGFLRSALFGLCTLLTRKVGLSLSASWPHAPPLLAAAGGAPPFRSAAARRQCRVAGAIAGRLEQVLSFRGAAAPVA